MKRLNSLQKFWYAENEQYQKQCELELEALIWFCGYNKQTQLAFEGWA